jgi:hypothetical protein
MGQSLPGDALQRKLSAGLTVDAKSRPVLGF